MHRLNKKVDVEKVVKTLMVPLSDVSVLMAMRSALGHFERSLTRTSQAGPHDEQAMREGREALRQLLVVAHAATGALLTGMERYGEESGSLQEVPVARPVTKKRPRKPAESS